jgi:hypothetical protein
LRGRKWSTRQQELVVHLEACGGNVAALTAAICTHVAEHGSLSNEMLPLLVGEGYMKTGQPWQNMVDSMPVLEGASQKYLAPSNGTASRKVKVYNDTVRNQHKFCCEGCISEWRQADCRADTIKAKGKWKKQHAHALQARQQQGLLDVVQMVTTQPGQQPPPPEQEDQQQAPADEHAADMDMHTGGGGGSEFIVSSSAASCPAVACNNDSNSPTPGGFGLGMDLDYSNTASMMSESDLDFELSELEEIDMDTALSIDAGAGAETHARGSPFADSVNSLFTTPTKMAAVPVVLDEHAVRQLKYLGSDGQMHGDVPSPEKRASDSKLLQDEMLAQNQLKHQQTERAHHTNRVQQRTIDLQTKQMDAQAHQIKKISESERSADISEMVLWSGSRPTVVVPENWALLQKPTKLD